MSWFGRKQAPPMPSPICADTLAKGPLRFLEGLPIDGKVHGDVVSTGDGHSMLAIGENGRVHGMVKAGHVMISIEARGQVVCA